MEESKVNRLLVLLDNEQFKEARSMIDEILAELLRDKSRNLLDLASVYGVLNDLGNESYCEKDLKRAISFLEENEEGLTKVITKSSYYYNLANAKHGLTDVYVQDNPGVPSLKCITDLLQEPVSLYWLAHSNHSKADGTGLLQQITINLSNSLGSVSRFVEGIQFLDTILRVSPEFPQALISRAAKLEHLSLVTNCSVTVALYYRIYDDYNSAIETGLLPSPILQKAKQGRTKALQTIESYGFKIADIAGELETTKREFNSHTAFRKFCITNFLTLNEHTLYCGCIASEADDLRIGVQHAAFKSNLVGKLELLLNRLKSEFAMARWLYYQANTNQVTPEFDTKYSELLDGEIINPHCELLRTSFRICYGILDKIALGICKVYGVDAKRIHFENFWDDSKRKTKLEQVRNIH